MAKRSIVDDLKAEDINKGHGGYPILFENTHIRKMLRLAKAGKNDIFCDLGCGLAQNLIIAASEFNVRKAVGFERNEKRFKKAVNRIKFKGLGDKCEVIPEPYEKVLDGKSKKFKLEDTTVVFYGLATDTDLLRSLEKSLQDDCRLVYYNLCLFPEIMPNKVDFPFFVSKFPFKKTTSELEWLSEVVDKEKSTINKGKRPDTNELWYELSHDNKVASIDAQATLKNYKKRMRLILAS